MVGVKITSALADWHLGSHAIDGEKCVVKLRERQQAANNVEDNMRIIVWTPNGSGSSLAKIARTPLIKDNNNTLKELKCRLKS